MASTVKVVNTGTHLRVYLNGLLHLWIPFADLASVQSYIADTEGFYKVEYLVDGNLVVCEYLSEKLWMDILKGLDKVL